MARDIWIVARGHGLYAYLTLIVLGCAVQVFGPSTFPVPTLVAPADVRVAVTGVASLLIAVGTAQLCTEPAVDLARVAPRPWFATRAVRVTIGLTAGLTAGLLTAPSGFRQSVLCGLFTFLAEALLMARLAGVPLLWMLPTAHLLVGMTIGSLGEGHAQPWAWFLTFHPGVAQQALCAFGALAALTLWAAHHPDHDDAQTL